MGSQQTVILGAANEDLSECVWWAGEGDDIAEQTLFLYRKESGQDCLLDRFSISPESVPSFEDFQIEVKQQFGGGIYKAVIRNPKGHLVKNKPFALAGLPKRTEQQAEPVAPVQQESGLEKVLAVIVQQNQQMQQNFLAGLQAISQNIAQIAQKPAEDPLVMVERVANVLGKTGATPQPQKTALEQALEFKQLKDLFADEVTGSSDGWGSITTALAPLAEMMKENAVNERLKLEIESKRQARQAANAQKQQAQAANPMRDLVLGLKPILSQVIPFAEQGADALDVASGVFSAAPKDGHGLLKQFLQRQDALSILAQLEPKIGQHWDWFAELAGHLLELIDNETRDNRQADNENSTAPNQATNSRRREGDAANPKDNGKASAPRPRKRPSATISTTAS